MLLVVDAAQDEGAVRIAVVKTDDHFLPDARNELRAPSLACPARSDTHGTGLVRLRLRRRIPEERDLDAPIAVHLDILVGLAMHHGGLYAGDDGTRRDLHRTERLPAAHRTEVAGERRFVLIGLHPA